MPTRMPIARLLVLAACLVPAMAQDAPAPAKIGFVDLKIAFTKFHKTVEREAALRAWYDTKEKAFEAEEKLLSAAQTELEQMSPADATTRKARELYLRKSRLDFNRRWANLEAQDRLRVNIIELYLEVLAAVDTLGRTEGYDAILQIDSEPLQVEGVSELKLLMRSRSVLYFRKPLDLTDAVIRLLNTNAPAGPPPK